MPEPQSKPHAVLDPMDVAPRRGTAYPPPFDAGFEGRLKRKLTEALGLTQFGVNVVTLEPGAMSSQRHWHRREDEFVYVLQGPITLVTDEGERELPTGTAVGFSAGNPNGHHLVNRGDRPVTYLEVGTRADEEQAEYPDIDLRAIKEGGRFRFTDREGRPLPR